MEHPKINTILMMGYTYWKQLKRFLGLTTGTNTSGSPYKDSQLRPRRKVMKKQRERRKNEGKTFKKEEKPSDGG